jgi:protein O-GlcNAc transferase
VYQSDAYRTDNLLLMAAIHFQLRNFSEAIFYNQQAIRVDPNFAEAYGNLGNALKELGDVDGAMQFYLKAIKLKPRFADAYNNLATAHMQLGHTKQAIETFKMALLLDGDCADAHNNLGVLMKAQGNLEEAKRSFLEALRVKPTLAVAWSNLAGVFRDAGDSETAITYYQEAVRLSPEFADAHSNMGNAHHDQGDLEQAMAAFREALRLRPDFPIAHGNLGACLLEQGDAAKAIASLRRAVQLEPNFPDAYNNLGNAYTAVGKLDEAIKSYRTCLALKPDHPQGYSNLGIALRSRGMVNEAVHCFMTACRLRPSFAAGHCNLATILREQGKPEQSIAHYQEALRIDPRLGEAYFNMGAAYQDVARLEEAVKCYSTAIRLNPSFAMAYVSLGNSYFIGSKYKEAHACYTKALKESPDCVEARAWRYWVSRILADWATCEEDWPAVESHITACLADGTAAVPAVEPFQALALPLDQDVVVELGRRYLDHARSTAQLGIKRSFAFKARRPGQRIRVGYLGSAWGNDSLTHALHTALSLHDASLFEVTLFSSAADDGSHTRRNLQGIVEHFKDVGSLTDAELASLIHKDGIHVLVDVGGLRNGGRPHVVIARPAPVVVGLLGYAGPMGDAWDYVVSDNTMLPEAVAHNYATAQIRIPGTCITSDHRHMAVDVLDPEKCPTRSDVGLPEDAFVFAAHVQTWKLDKATWSAWMQIMKGVPGSVLWLLNYPAEAIPALQASAKSAGIAESRIHVSPLVARSEHLKRLYLADLFLDTPAFSGVAAATDALWAGVPILTLAGASMARRAAASALASLGVQSLITLSLEEYVSKAISIAADMESLWALRRRIEEARPSCALFDTRAWVKSWEAGLQAAWSRYESGLGPATVDGSVHERAEAEHFDTLPKSED